MKINNYNEIDKISMLSQLQNTQLEPYKIAFTIEPDNNKYICRYTVNGKILQDKCIHKYEFSQSHF